MWVRGAPLIGATAAYGVAVEMKKDPSNASLDETWDILHETRPTAINLRWALNHMREFLKPLPRLSAQRQPLNGQQKFATKTLNATVKSASTGWRLLKSCGQQETRRTGQYSHPLQCRLAGNC